MDESLEQTQDTVRWLRNLHVWGIVAGLPMLAWLIGRQAQSNRRT